MKTQEIVRVRQQAQEDLGKVHKPEALLASAEGQPFSAIFGRDLVITCLFLIEDHKYYANWNNLYLVRDSLLTLAANQGTKLDPETEEEPGKIEHENRSGLANQPRLEELARNFPVKGKPGERYLRYWGSVDATELFEGVAVEYIRITRDWELFKRIENNLKAGILWMEHYGDLDGDGFIEYQAKNRDVLINQGWKDSANSILTPDGQHPEEPIALVEIQGYAYWAYTQTAWVFEKAGEIDFANHLRKKAASLREKFNRDFWMSDEQFYAYALDGDKNKICDIVSNVGHLLITGILNRNRAGAVVKRLMQKDMLTKYGIRTLSSNSPHFRFSETNPEIQKEAYHDGTVWPHENAIITLGMKKYGFAHEARVVRNAVLSAISQLGNVELYQVNPDGTKLVPYEKAAKPQTWAIASAFLWTAEEQQILERLRKLINPVNVLRNTLLLKTPVVNR